MAGTSNLRFPASEDAATSLRPKKNVKSIVANIARLVEPFSRHSGGHESATSENRAAFIAHLGSPRPSFIWAIQTFTGLLVSDLRAIDPQHRRKDVFKLRLFKNHNGKPVDLETSMHPILEGVLPIHPVRVLIYLVTDFEKPSAAPGAWEVESRTGGGMPAVLTSPRIQCGQVWRRTEPTKRPPTVCLKRCSVGRMGKRRGSTRAMQSAPVLHGKA